MRFALVRWRLTGQFRAWCPICPPSKQALLWVRGVGWATRARVVPLWRPHWFGALVWLRSMGTGRLLNAGGAVEEFIGGVQFRMEFRFVEVSGGTHPLIFCWGRWKNGWGVCLGCWDVFRQFPAFDPLWLP